MKNLLVCVVIVVAACGGDSKSNDGIGDCTALGVACTDSAACCSNNCDPTALICSRVPGTCGADNDACQSGPDCCSFRCEDGECSGDQCISDGASCGGDSECCGGLCGNGTCTALNPSCKTSGNACTTNNECCGAFCKANVCSNSVSFCTQIGDTCTADNECCGGACVKASGATLGTCEQVPSPGGTGCAGAGQVCGEGANYMGGPLPTCGGECCSRACFPYGPTGALVCQPPSGCRPTGELCLDSSDCCGGPGTMDHAVSNVMCRKSPGFTIGRCDNGNSCSPAGAICRLQSISCNANANCCAGNVLNFDTCHQDSLGIPRCGADNGGTCMFTPGMSCSSSADCCGNPCVPTPGSEFGFVCGSGCVVTGASCTTSADCCNGAECTLDPGSSQGICGPAGNCQQYGQACSATMLCCNNVPCTNGYCVNDVIN